VARLLLELSRQLDRGVVYDRDRPMVVGALREVLASLERRTRQGDIASGHASGGDVAG
jgi:hypothetical protein